MVVANDFSHSNDLKKQQNGKKKKSFLDLFLEHAKDFCDKTSLHGFRYVTEEGAHWIQSLVWATFIILGVIFCCILMFLIWGRFSANPTITAVETINYPVWKVPFPSITICDVNKVHKSKIGRINNILLSNNITQDEAMSFFRSLSFLINNVGIQDTFDKTFRLLEQYNISVENLMLELTINCSELLIRCTWSGTVKDCGKLFKTIKTDEGFCCGFNFLHSNESFDRYDDRSTTELNDTVIYTAGAGIHSGLSVIINIDETNYLSSTRLVPSALFLVQSHEDYPEMRTLSTLIKKQQLIHTPIEPSVIDTSEDVKSIHYTKRNCTFVGEEVLTIGKYGYENCIIECRMDAIFAMCGCLPFYFNVKYYKYQNPKFCTLVEMKCVADNHQLFYTISSDELDSTSNSSFGLKCRCYPTCDVNWYTYTSDIGDFIEGEGFGADGITALHIYYSEFSCIKYKQSNLITWDGLFASFGGIFGLCLGGSILSVVEFIYHFSIRLYMFFEKAKLKDHQEVNKQNLVVDSKWNETLTIENSLKPPAGVYPEYLKKSKKVFPDKKAFNISDPPYYRRN